MINKKWGRLVFCGIFSSLGEWSSLTLLGICQKITSQGKLGLCFSTSLWCIIQKVWQLCSFPVIPGKWGKVILRLSKQDFGSPFVLQTNTEKKKKEFWMALQYRKLFNFHRWLLGGTSHSLGRSSGGGSEEKEKIYHCVRPRSLKKNTRCRRNASTHTQRHKDLSRTSCSNGAHSHSAELTSIHARGRQ